VFMSSSLARKGRMAGFAVRAVRLPAESLDEEYSQ